MTLAGRLPSTRWSLVVRAGNPSFDPSDRIVAQQSLAELCEMYWPALYGYLRRCGRSPEDAEDLTQGFLTHLIQRESLASADATRGRFRAFLYASLDHYVANECRHDHAVKRGGQARTFSINRQTADQLDRANSGLEIVDGQLDPAAEFDRQWAHCLIRQTLADLQTEYREKGKLDWFEKLSPLLTTNEMTTQKRNEIASELGLSATALKVAIHRLRNTYRQRLLDAVAQTVQDPGESGSERQCLFDALGER